MKRCTFEDCTRTYVAKGLCSAHYKQLRDGKELRPIHVPGAVKAPAEPTFLQTDMTWQERGNCNGLSVQESDRIFYPDNGHYEEAREMCADCPVKAQCLALALAAEQGADIRNRFGFFGGTTPSDRMTLTGGTVQTVEIHAS